MPHTSARPRPPECAYSPQPTSSILLSRNSSGFQDARAASLVVFSVLADTPSAEASGKSSELVRMSLGGSGGGAGEQEVAAGGEEGALLEGPGPEVAQQRRLGMGAFV